MDKSIVPVNQIATRSSTCYEFSNSNPAEVVELENDPVEVVERQIGNLKLNHQFNENDVPKIFRDLMKDKMSSLKTIELNVFDQYCSLILDKIEVRLEKIGHNWLIAYEKNKKTVKTDDPENSAIEHLWFVLKNPNIKLEKFRIQSFKNPQFEIFYQNQNVPKIDFEKLSSILKSMIDSIGHQFHSKIFTCAGFKISMCLSMLKHLKPQKLEGIEFNISWKNEQNYRKMKEIVEMDQWKQAKRICSVEFIPSLKIDDLLHCECFTVNFVEITPEDVVRVKELFINSINSQSCVLFYENKDLDIDAFRKALLPNSLGEKKVKTLFMDGIVFTYKFPNSSNCLEVLLDRCNFCFKKHPN